MTDAQGFLDELARKPPKLPFDPGLLREVLKLTSDDSRAPANRLAEVVGRDQALSTRLLRMANSAYYGLQSEVPSVQRAVAVLGMAEVRALILAVAASGIAGRRNLPATFDLSGYWRHQLCVAACCRMLARRVSPGEADVLYTAGLLHDIGKLLMAGLCPDAWQAVQALMAEEHLETAEAEERHWGLDHGVIGARLLSYWDLPPALTEPVNWHHAPQYAGAYERNAQLLNLADRLLLMYERGDGVMPVTLADDLATFGLDAHVMAADLSVLLEGERIGQLVAHLAA
ncbi:MAG TPA: HD family phosphohydrolase [Desulfovibrio sp.]|nr:HD family phosphohydrolase [Desulfovibrio sp.]